MHRRFARCAATAGAVATTLSLGLGAAPAHAQAPWEVYSKLTGIMTWTTAGPVAGSPGNAHSGFLLAVSDEGYLDLELMDWRCPRGMTPPTSAAEDSADGCRLLRDRDLSPTEAGAVTFSGPLAMSMNGTWTMDVSWWKDGEVYSQTERTGSVDADVVRIGTLQRTDTHSTSDGEEEWDTTYTARMQVRGTIADVTLPNPRSPQVTQSWTRRTERYRPVS